MNIILLGPPGAGKGTQANLLVQNSGFSQIATGDLLRSEIEKMSPLGQKVKQVLSSGQLVDDETMVRLIEVNIDRKMVTGEVNFIFDGFPRTIQQAVALDDLLNIKGMVLNCVIKLIVDDEMLIKRVSGRYACASCGAGYHDTLNMPRVEGVCDSCGGMSFKRRNDDNEQTVRSRLASYYKITDPLTEHYKNEGKLYEVDGMVSINQISDNIRQITEQCVE